MTLKIVMALTAMAGVAMAPAQAQAEAPPVEVDAAGSLREVLTTLATGYEASGGGQASPLVSPAVETPIGFMVVKTDRPTHTLHAALELARDTVRLRHAASHSGMLTLAA